MDGSGLAGDPRRIVRVMCHAAVLWGKGRGTGLRAVPPLCNESPYPGWGRCPRRRSPAQGGWSGRASRPRCGKQTFRGLGTVVISGGWHASPLQLVDNSIRHPSRCQGVTEVLALPDTLELCAGQPWYLSTKWTVWPCRSGGSSLAGCVRQTRLPHAQNTLVPAGDHLQRPKRNIPKSEYVVQQGRCVCSLC